jgi:hypothetical protein
MRPNPVRNTLRAGGTPYGTIAFEFSSAGLIAISAEVADFVLPPGGASAVESLIHQCEGIKIDGLKLYPPGPDAGGWVLDDEKNTYPLFDVLRRHGVKNVFG